jgi:hypothetical protein
MKSPHLLLAGNPQRVRANLVSILDALGLAAIDKEIYLNAARMYDLALQHYNFATELPKSAWRHKMSRLYYAAYHVSRCLRFMTSGEYCQEVTDHKKVNDLPQDLPNRATYANRLTALRDDRNLADYDHTATEAELVIPVAEAASLVEQLLRDAHAYLRDRKVPI